MKNKKKTLIMCAASLLCLIIIVLLALYWFNSGKLYAQGKFFTAESKRASSKKMSVTISGKMPEGCRWTVDAEEPFVISSEKQSEESFSFKIAADGDGFTDLSASCITEDGSEYSRLVILTSSDKKRVTINTMSFMYEPVVFTPVEGLENAEIKISDEIREPELIIGKNGSDWSFVYDPECLVITETSSLVYEYVETGVKNEAPMLIVNEEESDTQSVKVTPSAAGSTVLTLVNRDLALAVDLEFEAVEDENESLTIALVSANEGTYEFDGAAEKAAKAGSVVSGYKLPADAVVMTSYGFTVEKDAEGTGIDKGNDGVMVEFLFNDSVMDLFMTDKWTAPELGEAVFGDLSGMNASVVAGVRLYSDFSEDGQSGCAAVWSEGNTAYVLAAPCSAEKMKLAIDSMK